MHTVQDLWNIDLKTLTRPRIIFIKSLRLVSFTIRELVNNGTILVKYCATGDMLADLLTKGLAAPQHKKLITNLNMV